MMHKWGLRNHAQTTKHNVKECHVYTCHHSQGTYCSHHQPTIQPCEIEELFLKYPFKQNSQLQDDDTVSMQPEFNSSLCIRAKSLSSQQRQLGSSTMLRTLSVHLQPFSATFEQNLKSDKIKAFCVGPKLF